MKLKKWGREGERVRSKASEIITEKRKDDERKKGKKGKEKRGRESCHTRPPIRSRPSRIVTRKPFFNSTSAQRSPLMPAPTTHTWGTGAGAPPFGGRDSKRRRITVAIITRLFSPLIARPKFLPTPVVRWVEMCCQLHKRYRYGSPVRCTKEAHFYHGFKIKIKVRSL